jgi:hypothetical protein
MPTPINEAEVRALFEGTRAPQSKRVMVGGKPVDVDVPFPSGRLAGSVQQSAGATESRHRSMA